MSDGGNEALNEIVVNGRVAGGVEPPLGPLGVGMGAVAGGGGREEEGLLLRQLILESLS